MRQEWKHRLTIAGIVLGVIAGFRWLLPAAVPFLAAWLLAEWIYPTAVKAERRLGIKKEITAAALLLLTGTAVLLILFFLGREFLRQIRLLLQSLPDFREQGQGLLRQCCLTFDKSLGLERGYSQAFLTQQMSSFQGKLMDGAGEWAQKLFGCVNGFFLVLSAVVVAFISCILMVGDMEKLHRKILDYSGLNGARHVLKRLKKTTVVYLKAQLMIMVLVGAVCAAAFWLMGNSWFLVLGTALGALDALPVIGTGTFLYPAAIVFLLKGKTQIAVSCVLLDIVTSLLREFLEPRLLGERLGVSPIAILASVYLGVLLYGGWGVFLGPLCFSAIYEIGKELDVWGP